MGLMTIVSVVIPTFNREVLIQRALHSVIKQQNVRTEIIVVDDGSTDNTEQVIREKFKSVKYLKKNNAGVSSARNVGIKNANGNFIALLDSDDEWERSKLDIQLKYLTENHTLNLVHCNEKWIKSGFEIRQKKYHDRRPINLFERSLRRCLISPSSVLIRKERRETVGYFDETHPACAEYDHWLRNLDREEIGYIEDQLITKYGGHADQLSIQTRYLDLYRLQSLVKLIKSPRLSKMQKMQIEKEIEYKSKIVLAGAKKHENSFVINQYNQILSNVL